jgi:hypothetical protein
VLARIAEAADESVNGRVTRPLARAPESVWASVSASTTLQICLVSRRRKPDAAIVPAGGVDTAALDGDPVRLRHGFDTGFADWVRAQIASAPPLSREQFHRLSRLFESQTGDGRKRAKPYQRARLTGLRKPA